MDPIFERCGGGVSPLLVSFVVRCAWRFFQSYDCRYMLIWT